MGIWGKEVGYPKFLKGVPKCPESFPQMFAYGHQGKWALGLFGERGTLSTLTGYHKCPALIFPKFFQIGSGENEHLEQINIWGKGYPKWFKRAPHVPCAYSPQIFADGHQANGQLSTRVILVPVVPCTLIFRMSARAKWVLGQMGTWVPMAHFPHCPFEKFGGNGYRTLGVLFSPNVHLLQQPICPSAHLHTFGGNGHRALGVPLSSKCTFAPSAHLPQCPFVNI